MTQKPDLFTPPPPPPTAAELRQADRWEELAAAEDRPHIAETCRDLAAKLRSGWGTPAPGPLAALAQEK